MDAIQNRSDPYSDLFRKATTELSKKWASGVFPYIEMHHKELAEQISASEHRLDELWGNAPLLEFREELKRFYRLHIQALKLFRSDYHE